MSESWEWAGGPATSEVSDPSPTVAESTGDAAVDAVVASLRGLDDLPVAEHVAVFERAHESLRQVLNGAGASVPAGSTVQADQG
jgi:hypothetical protein